MPSLVGAIGVLSLATAHAIEPPIAANTVDTKDQQPSGLDYSENLTPGTTLNTDLVAPIELLEEVEPQQLNFTPIATQLDTENSRETEFLSSALFVPEAT
ncbi:MAG TPA: hypothetical protein V6C65_39085, partial [Allocoleopsis sp.]